MGQSGTKQYPNPSRILKKFSNPSQTNLIKIQTRPIKGRVGRVKSST